MSSNPPRLAFLGLGAMGRRMALRLAPHFSLTVYNRSPEPARRLVDAGADLASSPREATQGADIVLTMLTDDDACESVWFGPNGALEGLAKGALAIEVSTITPSFVQKLAQPVESQGAHLLDAPVAGSTPQAEAGKLAFLVGGRETDLERARPVLDHLSAVILHAGQQTAGSVLKLAVNSLFAGQVALMAEALRLGAAGGIPAGQLLSLLEGLPVTSPAAFQAGKLMEAGDHAPRFPVDLVEKDLRYANSLAPSPLLEATLKLYLEASLNGHGGKNLTAVSLPNKGG